MPTRRVSFPRICIAVTVGLLLGLVALTLASVARYGWSTQPTQPVALIHKIKNVAGWQPPPTSTVINIEEPVTLLFVGDIMLDRTVAIRSQKAKDIAYPFRKLPSHWFDEVDYAIANLEGPVTSERRPPEKIIDFQFDPIIIPILKEQGIDAVSQANNHSLDQGREGAKDSHARLQDAGILVFGDQVRDDDIALATTTIRGKRFAFVGFNTTDNTLDADAASTTLAHARESTDYVLAFMHWGPEYKDRPSDSMVQEAHWLIDHGVDAVIGGHPHWVQGIVTYKNKPIVYSLGNFIFDQDFSVETRQGLAVKITFLEDQLTLEPIPLQIDLSQPRLVEGEARLTRLRHLADISDEALRGQIRGGKVKIMLP